MDYYQEILSKCDALLVENKVQEAYDLLEEELRMPYIPKDSEEKIIALYNECRQQLEMQKPQKTYTEEDLEDLLSGTLDEQFAAVEVLKSSNIRRHLPVIEHYFCGNPHYLVRSLLVEALIDQQVHGELKMDYEGMEITFDPGFVEMPMESDGALQAVAWIREWFENDNPSFAMMCVETLVKEAYLKLPFNIDEDESQLIALAAVKYVFYAYGEQPAFEKFLAEKALAQSSGYELLLNKHDME